MTAYEKQKFIDMINGLNPEEDEIIEKAIRDKKKRKRVSNTDNK